ncbi:MAG: ROK family protein [Calditrichaeota bacterium]|nr:ROK family protein [Calditrichota bacterium]
MKYKNDKRTVMTLDAGGTNFVFSAIRANEEIIEPIRLPSDADNLEKCLNNIVEGFSQVKSVLKENPVAISFAFPGPADYPNGIIGDLGNLPSFRGGIALGPMLADKFKLPVFINNDGDLFAYGEALAGYLPYINQKLEEAGSPKRYKNLVGFTLGTGFGGGIVRNGELFIGDNSGAAEVWLLRNKLAPQMNAEEGVSIRAIRRVYAQETGTSFEQAPEPRDIYEIGIGNKEGNRQAAAKAYRKMAEVLGDALGNVLTIVDGIAVIGGGISGARDLFMQPLLDEINSSYTGPDGNTFRRLSPIAYNLEDDSQLAGFLKGESKEITVPGSGTKVMYDPLARVGVGLSKIGTSKAVALGAYSFALNAIDNR